MDNAQNKYAERRKKRVHTKKTSFYKTVQKAG